MVKYSFRSARKGRPVPRSWEWSEAIAAVRVNTFFEHSATQCTALSARQMAKDQH